MDVDIAKLARDAERARLERRFASLGEANDEVERLRDQVEDLNLALQQAHAARRTAEAERDTVKAELARRSSSVDRETQRTLRSLCDHAQKLADRTRERDATLATVERVRTLANTHSAKGAVWADMVLAQLREALDGRDA